jgi:hypothetical protein
MTKGQDGGVPEPIAFTPIAPHTQTVRGCCAEAHITLRAPHDDALAEIMIALRAPDGFGFAEREAALAALEDGSPAWWRMADTAPGRSSEQGGFATVADGIRLIELARRTHDLPPIPDQLQAAGFVPHPTCPDLWLRRGRQTFKIVWKPSHVLLAISRNGRQDPTPLLRLQMQHAGARGTPIPCTWPSYLQDQAMHVRLACQMADDFVTDGRAAARPRRRAA